MHRFFKTSTNLWNKLTRRIYTREKYLSIFLPHVSALIISLMKFFTYLAAFLLSLSSTVVFAQDADDELKGELKFENVTMGGYAQGSTPMAITSDGNVVMTGTTASVTTGLTSSFIAMSSKDLPSSPLWKIDLDGSSIVTSIVSDGNGGIFVGGNFRSSIKFNGANGNIITLTGNFDTKDYSGTKINTFIAHINKEGKTLAAKAITSTANPDVLNDNQNYDPYKAYCNLSSLVYANGKLYAGLNFQDVISNDDDSKKLASATYVLYGALSSSTSFTVAEIDLNSMGISSFPIVLGGNSSDTGFMGLDIKNAKIASDGTNLYLAATPTGWSSTVTLWLNDKKSDDATFDITNWNINGFYVASINLLSNQLVASKHFDGVCETSDSNSKIGDIFVSGDNLVIAGSFMQNCPFNKSIRVVGNTDLFTACLNKSDLSPKSVLTSQFDETKSGDQEVYSCMGVLDDMLSISGYVTKNSSKNEMVAPLSFFAANYSSNNAEFEENDSETDDEYIIGAVLATDGSLYLANLSNDQQTYFYLYSSKETDGVKNIEAAPISKDAVIYNLQGMKLRAPQKGLNIINGKKVLVK